MKVRHLFNLGRYRRAQRIFCHPLRVHWHVAIAKHNALDADLLSGGRLRIADVRQCRAMFDWLLEQSADPYPIIVEDDMVVFSHKDNRVSLRANGTDFLVFKEIYADDVYRIGMLGNTLGTVMDIGANVGLFALRVAPLAARVISVEPVSGNLAMIRRNIERANLSDKVSLHHRAVTGLSGKTVKIYLSNENHGGNSISEERAAEWGSAGYETVATISLADLFANERIERCHILKCDTEGAEYDIFLNAPLETLKRIDRILMEIHLDSQDREQQQFKKLYARLEAAGFAIDHEPLVDSQGRSKRVLMLFADRDKLR